jgi:RNA polymerase sigma factor (sigma-70 family)
MSPEEIIDCALERYERPLISYAKAITGDTESARDAVQETFLRLSRQDIGALESRLVPWLFFVCRNCALDQIRKIARFSGDAIDEEHPAENPSPAAEVVAAEETARLRWLVDQLPLQQRELINLKFEEGIQHRSVRRNSGEPVSRCKARSSFDVLD